MKKKFQKLKKKKYAQKNYLRNLTKREFGMNENKIRTEYVKIAYYPTKSVKNENQKKHSKRHLLEFRRVDKISTKYHNMLKVNNGEVDDLSIRRGKIEKELCFI